MTITSPQNLLQMANEFGLPSNTPFPSGFYGKGGAPSSGAMSFNDMTGRSGTSPITVTVTNNNPTVSGRGTTLTTPSVTINASGGSGTGYSYKFIFNDGDSITADSPNSQTSTFTASDISGGESRRADFAAQVTDSTGAIGTYNYVRAQCTNTL